MNDWAATASAETRRDSAYAPDGEIFASPSADGPLDGLSFVVKDLFDVAGHVTAAGNPTLAEGPAAEHSAPVVDQLLAHGATLVGKTATDELAMGMFGVNTHYGTPPNPAALDRVPGGSSSGSASLVAQGVADLGIGTDTGGSIRVPASFCGLFGLRPTHGRIDISGVRPMAPRFDTVGLLARDVRVLGAGFAASAPPQPVREVTKLVLLTDLVDLATADVARLTRSTARAWARQLDLPLTEESLDLGDLRTVFWPLMSAELWRSNGEWVTTCQPVLGAGIEQRIRAAAEVPTDELEAAEAARARLVQRRGELLSDGVAVLPTAKGAAPLRTSAHEELMAYRDENLSFVVPASLAGTPQLSLPAGSVPDRATGATAPVGVSLLGVAGDDETLIALATRLMRPEQAL